MIEGLIIAEVTEKEVHLSDGTSIPCGMVVWSTGVAPRYIKSMCNSNMMCSTKVYKEYCNSNMMCSTKVYKEYV